MRPPISRSPSSRHPLFRIAALLAVAAALVAAETQPGGSAVERYMEHVRYLAAPEMRGRGAGMEELDRAAEYIANHFRSHGLAAAGDDGSYLQRFELTTGASMGESNSLLVERNSGPTDLKLGDDFVPINFSTSGKVEGEVVFAGYGATADELAYDDYFHFDVRDKIVLVLRYEPEFFGDPDEQAGTSERRNRRRRYTRHANLISKAIQARNRGAKAVLVVDSRSRGSQADGLIKFGSIAGPADAGIPMVQVHRAVADKWLRGSGRSLRLLERDIEASKQPQTFALASSLRVKLEVDVEREKAVVSNVAGYLPGATDQYLVVGAHYDHLGLGDQGSLSPSRVGEVHPGADDNASGVAAILELARDYANRPERPRRGMLFLAFAGEEIGLLGSSHWADHPTLPLENAVAMLNFDMVGRIQDRRLFVGGLGTSEGFEPMVDRVATEHSLQIQSARRASSSSDHTSFAAKKIPVLFFFSGLHSDYHKPDDTADKINAAAALDLLGIARDIVDQLRTASDRPVFLGNAPIPSPGGTGGGGYGPWFGSVPDFGEVPNGLRFADVRAGSPASKAGLEGGDILTHWNGDPVQNLHDFTYFLRASEVGETVSVRVLRDGKELTAEVTLAERP